MQHSLDACVATRNRCPAVARTIVHFSASTYARGGVETDCCPSWLCTPFRAPQAFLNYGGSR